VPVTCLRGREDERGKEKGGGGIKWLLLTTWQKEGVSGAGVRAEEGEGWRVGGQARRSVAGTGPWPMGASGQHERGAEQGRQVTDPWARGYSNGWCGLNRFKIFKRFENVQIFQTLIDPNLTFPSSKNYNKIWF
jgi:hypothetical protein